MRHNILTAIVPIDLQRRPRDLIKKAISLASEAEKKQVNIIFGHNNRSTHYDKIFLDKALGFSNVTVNSPSTPTQNINNSALRNIAFRQVKSDFIVLLDVDIYPDFDLFLDCIDEISSHENPFIILPCLYLTRAGSKYLLNSNSDTQKLNDKYFSFSRKEFLHLAVPSSIVVMKRCDYQNINGFNEDFNGHGYEDFDFLARLALYHRLIKLDSNFCKDITYRSPLFSVGFRKTLGELCLSSLIKKRLTFHLHHGKNSQEIIISPER